MEENKKSLQDAEQEEEELSLDDLAEVSGGAGMRHVKKEVPQDITQSIKDRI